jgi:NAD(P)-dependent dehydrogenase (short-subunit alcohol dehydrogenase family)
MISRESTAAIIGANGGLGAALAAACEAAGFAHTARFARAALDLDDEASIQAAAATLDAGPPLRLVIVATGVLHATGITPEKSLRTLDPATMAAVFRTNTIGPALVAKHFVPRLAREGRAVFAALSARVGSISDNRLGGWYSYRASKAALNMIVRNLAIETARTRPEQVCVGLHPGTVATSLSAPFAAPDALTAADSAQRLLAVLDSLTPERSGRCIAFDGLDVPA